MRVTLFFSFIFLEKIAKVFALRNFYECFHSTVPNSGSEIHKIKLHPYKSTFNCLSEDRNRFENLLSR